MPELTKIEREHILLHLQDAILQLRVRDYHQVAFDIYEIGQHLGFSPQELNNDF